MSNCATHSGFFVLSPCNRAASATCHNCGNYCCERHSQMAADGELYCLECTTKLNPLPDTKRQRGRNRRDDEEDDYDYDLSDVAWMYYFRNQFYETERFRPFEEEDYAGFEEGAAFSALDDELGEGGFFDS